MGGCYYSIRLFLLQNIRAIRRVLRCGPAVCDTTATSTPQKYVVHLLITLELPRHALAFAYSPERAEKVTNASVSAEVMLFSRRVHDMFWLMCRHSDSTMAIIGIGIGIGLSLSFYVRYMSEAGVLITISWFNSSLCSFRQRLSRCLDDPLRFVLIYG
jgi:hypothetical protein